MRIKSNIHDYDILFFSQEDISSFLRNEIQKMSSYICIIDNVVWSYYSDSLMSSLTLDNVIFVDAKEENKTLATVMSVYEKLIQRSTKRNTTLLAIGGGIIQDIAGFVASTFYRGIKWIFIPTTLLSQADSCLGGKTSLNFKGFKNIIGTFYPPNKILIYPQFANTLDPVFYNSGLGEVVKLQIMGGEEKVQQLINVMQSLKKREASTLQMIIQDSLEIKRSFIGDDEFDNGIRHLLNFGHCFGHALETVTDFQIPHGHAVALGMFLANEISVKRGFLSKKQHVMISDYLIAPIISTISLKKQENIFNGDKVIEAMKKDKKRIDDNLVVILLDNNYKLIEKNDLSVQEAFFALSKLEHWLSIDNHN